MNDLQPSEVSEAEVNIERTIHTVHPDSEADADVVDSDSECDGESVQPPDPNEAAVMPDIEKVITNASTSGKPYSAFTEGQKWFIVTLSAVGSTCSPISSNIYVPAIPTLVEVFHESAERINLTVTVYLIFQALTPALWGSMADAYGRRPIYMATLLIFTLACVGTALCPTSDYWLLLLMRILQASGGSATIAIGTGVISDVAMPQERGKYLGLFNATSTFGPAIGPLLGGVFAYTLGWRSIFWFLAIGGGVVLVPMILAFPETLRALVGDGSLPPPLLNCTPSALIRRRRQSKALKGEGRVPLAAVPHAEYRPWTSFLLLLEPDLLLVLLWASLYYALYYCVLTLYSTLLEDIYGFNEIVIGVCYISSGLGVAVSSVGTGRVMDRLYRREKTRVGGDHRACPDTFRLERVRFAVLPYLVAIMLISSISLGWTMQYHVHISVPIILNFFFGVGTGFLTTTTIYGIDLFPGQGGTVAASFNFVRCLAGAIFVGTIQLINKAMGAGWTFVLVAGICVLATPLPLIVLRYGPGWRMKRAERIRSKQAEKVKRAREMT